SGQALGAPEPFSFDRLTERARKLASKPYRPPPRPAPDIVKRIDYEAHGQIRFKPERALFADGTSPYPVALFHLGQHFEKSVKVYTVKAGNAREVAYSPDYFDMPADSIARKLPPSAGFAGIQIHESTRRADWKTQDWLAFLGASYFRAI